MIRKLLYLRMRSQIKNSQISKFMRLLQCAIQNHIHTGNRNVGERKQHILCKVSEYNTDYFTFNKNYRVQYIFNTLIITRVCLRPM